MDSQPRRVVVGITGASGSVYGVRLLERLRTLAAIEIHLVLSRAGARTMALETDWTKDSVERLAHVVYDDRDIGAAIASGSFRTDGMVIAPCSVKTASALAYCHADTLIARSGDVHLKEGRPLLVLVRETPLHLGHLRALVALAEIGGIVMPPVPAFYPRPSSLEELVDHTVGRVIERLGLAHGLVPEWSGGGRPPGVEV